MMVSIFLHQYLSLFCLVNSISIQKQAVKYFNISSNSARFLVVMLHGFRERHMYHKSHVGFANPHSKNNYHTDNSAAILTGALVLCVVSGRITEASVISKSSENMLFKE